MLDEICSAAHSFGFTESPIPRATSDIICHSVLSNWLQHSFSISICWCPSRICAWPYSVFTLYQQFVLGPHMRLSLTACAWHFMDYSNFPLTLEFSISAMRLLLIMKLLLIVSFCYLMKNNTNCFHNPKYYKNNVTKSSNSRICRC